MNAIILAAGTGTRLKKMHKKPKVLLEFNNRTLLERHIKNLQHEQIKKIFVVVGYQSQAIIEEIKNHASHNIEVVFNNDYKSGSILSVFCALKQISSKEDLLLMDGDVLYDKNILERLISNNSSSLVFDSNFDDDDEPVKVCIKDNLIKDFGKGKFSKEKFSRIGESVGFFKIKYIDTVKFRHVCEKMILNRELERPHEDAFRKIIHDQIFYIKPIDVTGLLWTEIDFPEDIEKALRIIPKLKEE
ncbi:MAG: phosphocholine cytidylyltransferase family protein [Pseudomonadota bacterium]|nr:phosphocholine cytidylyltransferase family protein [Pseudomonadota bacterium]